MTDVYGPIFKPRATVSEQIDRAINALNKQVGGAHYKDHPIQPVEYIHANKLGYFEGCVLKYITRWKLKNGVADLEKAKHYIELLIELETKRANQPNEAVSHTSPA